jgi:DNA polymerase III epsilon subunit-like protein
MAYTVYFDLETGGVEPRHPTIQLAAVAIAEDGSEADAFMARLQFNEADCDAEALKMNHYDPAAWANAIAPDRAVERFAVWLEPFRSVTLTSKRTGRDYTVAKLAGYNALTFDAPRLRQLFGTRFTPWSHQIRDVLQRALFWFDEHPEAPRPENYRLATVAAYFGLATDGAHDALADARMAAALYDRLRR